MALVATGLTTHIMNNQLRSVLLLLGFPVLLAGMMFAFFVGLSMLGQPYGQPPDWAAACAVAWRSTLAYAHWAVLAAGVWFVIAYVFQGGIMSAAADGIRVAERIAAP